MSKIIGEVLIFIALVTLVVSILALATLVNTNITKPPGKTPIPIFNNCSTDCIKTVGIISFVVFVSTAFGGIFLLKNKNGGDNTDNGDW